MALSLCSQRQDDLSFILNTIYQIIINVEPTKDYHPTKEARIRGVEFTSNYCFIDFIFNALQYLIMRQGSSMGESMGTFTRKELANWVESHTRYKYQDLKNGVFFCKILSIKYPEEASLLKYNPNPISEYDCTHNLNIMKKVLNKKGFQPNLNVQNVVSSKNNFELAKWFRCMFEPSEVAISNYSSVPRGSIATYRDLGNRKQIEETPKKQGEQAEDKGYKKKIFQSAEKSSKNSLSKVKRLSMAKSQAFFFKQKQKPPLPNRADLKVPTNKKDEKKQANQQYYLTEFMPKSNNQLSENDDINEMLYQRALEQSIESFTKILSKVKKALDTNGVVNYSQYKKQISGAIFNR